MAKNHCKNWSFKNLQEYKEYLECQEDVTFPFKTYIVKNGNTTFFNQTGFFIHHFIPMPPENKKDEPIESVLGFHAKNGLTLDSKNLYSPSEPFMRQGDIYLNSKDIQKNEVLNVVPIPTHWIIVTHTCNLSNGKYCNLLPGYIRGRIMTDDYLENLGVKRPNPSCDLVSNKKGRLLSFPPHELLNEEDVIFDLEQIYTVPLLFMKNQKPLVSLTLPANACFISRFTSHYFRDVEKWDDDRRTLG